MALEALKTTVLEMVSYVGSNFRFAPGIHEAVYAFFDEKTPDQINKHVGEFIKPQASYIAARDLQFFAEKKYEVFRGIPKPHIDRLSEQVLQSPPEVVGCLWDYFVTILNLYDIINKKKRS